ncbi:expressed unknown protein [Seminavis robusta]|uniref:Uncharacterized protein n=1 Tax=Seminavis robusta TaxID=568900 RepID=A0A9N8ECI4_9STRA|nr:expressed unknown protein [Seminavis robusta]|eukprot:Sro755_g197640.1 n/a (200) ;mRNA; f:34475-35074
MPPVQLDKRDLTKAELKKFGNSLWPAKPEEDPTELKELLDCCFYHYGEDDDHDEADADEQWKNFSAYTRKVGGFAWLNALHAFDGDKVLDTPLTYVLSHDPDECGFVSFLLQMGADANVRNSSGQPPLFLFLNAGIAKRYRTFSLLMESGANDKAVYGGMTMVQFAKEVKENDRVGKMVWEDFQQKYPEQLGTKRQRDF